MTNEFDLSAEISDLIQDTSAQLVSDTSVMHGRRKVPTPLPHLNAILGGGLPLGCIVEAFGVPSSGKSSSMYQTMGNFQKKYPKSLAIIVDTEASVDEQRMEFMGCDSTKVLRIPSTTLEDGFEAVFKILDKKEKVEHMKDLPVMILWDTIGINITRKMEEGGGQFAEGMMGKAKLIKHYLSLLMPYVERHDVLVILLNQVSTEMGRFSSSLGSSGGWSIKHNAHMRLRFNAGKTDYDGQFAVRTNSSVDLVKSKISPLFTGLPMKISIARGGVVESKLSMTDYAIHNLELIKSGSWFISTPLAERYPQYVKYFGKFGSDGPRYRSRELFEYIYEEPIFVKFLELAFVDLISEKYTYQAKVCAEHRSKLIEEIHSELGLMNIVLQNGKYVDTTTGEVHKELKKERKYIDSEGNVLTYGEGEYPNEYEIETKELKPYDGSVKVEESVEVEPTEDNTDSETEEAISEEVDNNEEIVNNQDL